MIARRVVFRRYASLLSIALAGSLMTAGLIELAFAARENVQRAQELHLGTARLVATRVAGFFGEIERNLGSISSSPWDRGLDLADRTAELQRVMRLLPAIRDVVLADREGREQLFVSRAEPNRERSGHPVAVPGAVQGKRVVGPVERDRTGRDPFVSFAIAERGSRGGWMIARINLQFVSEELARLQRRGREVAYVLDKAGRVVAHSDVSQPLRPEAGASIPLPLGADWRRDESGSLVLSVAHPVAGTPWSIVVEVPLRQALESTLSTGYRSLAFVGIAILIAILASWLLADRMARPVVTLKEGAEAFGSGNLAHRIDLSTGDELEDLAQEFNRMAAQLQEYTTDLERKVDEKTTALKQALDLAHEAMRARALFLAAASHDLRQPLYAISILADTLSTGPLPEASGAILEKQRQAIAVLRTLFDNLLDLSRFEAGEVRPVMRTLPLREVLAPVASQHEVMCTARGLNFECDLPEAWIRTDPVLVRRVVSNLLSNAVRYTDSGSVRLLARTEDGQATVEVADTGVGIAAEDQARIFDEFVQLANPSRERDKGVGLGLSIVKRICELLGLALELDSSPGHGTSVRFRLPLVDAPVVPGRGTDELARAHSGAFTGLRVWVLEDDPLVRDALRLQLTAWGARVSTAESATELVALHGRDGGRWPDAVMVDDMLGAGSTGLEVATRLQAQMADERILLVTGNADVGRLDRLERSGLTVLRKPIDSTDLAEWLAAAAAAPAARDPAPEPAG